MKYATKYSIVPYRPTESNPQTGSGNQIQDPNDYLINKLDNEMSSILSQKMNMDDKLQLYSKTLARFGSVYHTNSFNLPSVLAEISNKTNNVEKSLSDKIESLGIKLENEVKKEPSIIYKEQYNPIELKEEYPGNFKLESGPVTKRVKTGRITKSVKQKLEKDQKKQKAKKDKLSKQATKFLAENNESNQSLIEATELEKVKEEPTEPSDKPRFSIFGYSKYFKT